MAVKKPMKGPMPPMGGPPPMPVGMGGMLGGGPPLGAPPLGGPPPLALPSKRKGAAKKTSKLPPRGKGR